MGYGLAFAPRLPLPFCSLRPLAPLALLPLLAVAMGCARSIPEGRSAIDRVDIEGSKHVSEGDVTDKLATTASPRFLGVFEGVLYDYELFDRNVLERDLARVERYYRARGYYETHARAGRVITTKDKHVAVDIEVEEGPPVLISKIDVQGLDGLPDDVVNGARQAAADALKIGNAFDEDDYVAAESAVKRSLTDDSYAYASVERVAAVDIGSHTAEITLKTTPGGSCKYGAIHIEGLGPLPDAPVRRALDLDEGAKYSTAELDSARQAALDLGVFASVIIEPELSTPPAEGGIVPIHVKVEPTKLHTVKLGGGLELDVIKTDLHLQTGWEDRNFLGGMRRLTIDFRPGVVLFPTRLPSMAPPKHFLPEEKLRVILRQPGFLEARATGVFSAEANIYPVILAPQLDPSAPVVGYQELKGSAGIDRTLWKLYGKISYNFQDNIPFVYLGDRDPSLKAVTISYIDLLLHFDFRDNAVHPHSGVFVGNDLQVAGLGGQAQDVRVQPELRGYLPVAKKITIAARGTFGLLFPFNYGSTVSQAEGGALPADADRDTWVRDTQLVFFRGFFSGGPSSNRGYPLRGVGPHGVVPFFNPGVQQQQLLARCNPNDQFYDVARCALPLGGLTLWEASLETRFSINGPFEGAVFCDAGDVSSKRVNFRFDYLHLSCGVGARYDTPVGPIRLDLGYRIPGFQAPKSADPRLEGAPGTIFGVPLAVAFGIGESF